MTVGWRLRSRFNGSVSMGPRCLSRVVLNGPVSSWLLLVHCYFNGATSVHLLESPDNKVSQSRIN